MITSTGIISTQNNGNYSNLICPRCGGDYLHQGGGIFYERNEDDNSTIEITVENFSAKTDVTPSKTSRNPSSRRHGFRMKFSCEFCSNGELDLELSIAQHKGNTEIAWHYPPETKRS